MTGSGASGGFDFQASVTTAVMVHILRGTQLPWVRMTSRCIPEAVQAETGTPGDDILIEMTGSDFRIDVQAKKGLKRGARLNETIDAFAVGLASAADHYLLAVDGTSSASIKEDLREDLQRMGEGRFDPLSETGREVLERIEAVVDRDEIGRLHLVELNILTDWEAARQHYIQELRLVLEDPYQAETAWEILSIESLRLIRERGRATKQTIEGVLLRRDVRLNTADEKDVVRRNASARRALDRFQQIYSNEGAAEGHVVAVRRLLDHGQPEAAAALIAQIEADAELPMSPERRSTLLSLRGVSKIRLGDLEGARSDLADAIAHDAQNVVAHANLSTILIESGDIEAAERHAVQATDADPSSSVAWARRLIVAELSGQALEIPPEVADSSHVLIARLQIEERRKDWDAFKAAYDVLRASEGFSELGVDGKILVAHLLQQHALADGAEAGVASREEARRLTRSAVATLQEDRARAPLQDALILQGQLEILGDAVDEARVTLSSAVDLNTTSWRPSFLLAQLEFSADRPAEALAALDRYRGQESAFLFAALRAVCLVELDRRDEARAALGQIRSNESDLSFEDGMMVGEAALSVGLLDLAASLVEGLQPDGSQEWYKRLLEARLAMARGQTEIGLETYNAAVNEAPLGVRNEIAIERAHRLLALGRLEEAVEDFQQADVLMRGTVSAKRSFIFALMQLGRMSEAAVELGSLAEEDTPIWALELQAELANRRGDPAQAEEVLRRLVAVQPDRLDVKINLGLALLRQNRTGECSELVDEILESGHLTDAEEEIHAAGLCATLGRYEEALNLALRAVRKNPSEEIQLAFMRLCLAEPDAELPELSVGPGTAVALEDTRDSHSTTEYVIIDESIHGPRLAGELTAEDPVAVLLAGLSVGDTVTFREGTFNERKLRVASIISLEVHTFRKVSGEYTRLHPESNVFQAIPVGPEPDLGSLAPIIAQLTAHESRAARLVELYDESDGLPLGTLAKALGRGVPEVYAHLADRDERYLITEHADSNLYQAAVATAMESDGIVLTRSALLTARELEILGLVEAYFEEILVPQSLIDGLSLEVREIERASGQGRGAIASRGGRLVLTQESPEQTAAVREALVQGRDWAVEATDVRPLPLEALDEEPSKYRDYLDEVSYDCLALSAADGVPMYVDDLGLRRLLIPGVGQAAGFSTTALLDVLFEADVISADQLINYRIRLIGLRHSWVPVNADVLYQALFDVGFQPNRATIDVFERLQPQHCETSRAVSIGVDLLGKVALSTAAVHTRAVSMLLIESITTGRRPVLVLRALRAQAHERLRFLPRATDELDHAMRDYLEARQLS